MFLWLSLHNKQISRILFDDEKTSEKASKQGKQVKFSEFADFFWLSYWGFKDALLKKEMQLLKGVWRDSSRLLLEFTDALVNVIVETQYAASLH